MVEYVYSTGEIRLRYVGSRFGNARVPLDVLPDLPAFKDLLLAVVRAEWRRKSGKRVRLPRGFEHSFKFYLAGVENGTATPVMVWDRELAQESLPGMTGYLEDLAQTAMREIVGLVDGIGHETVPATLPRDVIRALNEFGSSLREGERIEFQGARDEQSNVVYLDADRRKRLLASVSETYDVRVEGAGSLRGSDLSGCIEVETPYGIVELRLDEAEVEEISDGNPDALVEFDLTLELDRQDKIRSVRTVHQIDLVDQANATALAGLYRRIEEMKSSRSGLARRER